MKIMSSFTHPYVNPNLYETDIKLDILENVCFCLYAENQSVCIDSSSLNTLPNIFPVC